MKKTKKEPKKYYGSIWYLQDRGEDQQELDRLIKRGWYKKALAYISEWDYYETDPSEIHLTPTYYPGDMLIAEDDEHALVVNNWVGGDYTLFRKMTQAEFDERDTQLGGELTEIFNKYNNR